MKTGNTVYYLLGDHLGSTSLTLNASGSVVSELRYTAWGSVRYESGVTPTEYTYTGQYGYDFGLMYFNARWLDIDTAHFAQADTIIPGAGDSQAWDRYAYVNNSPLKYSDPSGHGPKCEGKTGYQCRIATRKWAQANRPSRTLPDYGTYFGCGHDAECRNMNAHTLGISFWEYDIFDTLYSSGQADAVHGVNYMLSHGTRIGVGERFRGTGGDWQSMGNIGGWFDPVRNSVLLNPNKGYEFGEMPELWGLAIIVHEAKHLEQGGHLTKFKELEAWQVGILVASALKYYDKNGMDRTTINILNLPLASDATNIHQFSDLVKQYSRDYWLLFVILPAR